jgi:hypothetical protein
VPDPVRARLHQRLQAAMATPRTEG